MNEMLRRLALPFFIGLIVLGALAVRHVPISTDMSFFTPEEQGAAEDFLFNRMTRADGVAMIAVNGNDAAADRIAARLGDHPSVTWVLRDGMALDDKAVSFLIAHRYTLGPDLAEDEFSTDRMKAQIATWLKKLGSGMGPLYRDVFPRDPTGRVLGLMERDGQFGMRRDGGAWQKKPGRTMMLAFLNIGADDIPGHAEIRRVLYDAADDVGVLVTLSGPGFFALNASERIRSEMQLLAALATVGVAIVLFAAFRAPIILITIALPVGFGLIGGILMTSWIFGSVHGVAIAFGSVMIGVAVDYPVHLASFRRPDEAGYAVARRLFPVMILGAATTLAGFVILSQSSFPGLAQIGTLTATAIVIAVLFSRYLLPLALPERGLDLRPGRFLWAGLRARPGLRRGVRYLFYALPLAGLAAAMFSGNALWDDDIRHLRMASETEIRLDRELRTRLGMPDISHMILIRGGSRDEVMKNQWRASQLLEQQVKEGRLGGYLSITDIVPPPSIQQARLDRIPDIGELRTRLNQVLVGLPVKPDAFDPFFDDILAAKRHGPVSLDVPALHDLTLMMSTPVEAADGWVNAIQLVPPIGIQTFDVEGATLINLREMASGIVADYRTEGLELLLVGAVCGFVIVIVGRRGARAGLRVARVPVIAVAVTVAVLVLSGTPLSFFHLLALVLVVSIGVDYELFFAGYREGPAAGEHSFGSVMLCFVSTFVVFAVLATSKIPMLHNIGLTVALGAAVSFLVTIVRGDEGAPS
ncbi:MAG: MMPL family transporter [Rhodospirillales bacterium]|nr:MMPL family transporter [Rhodospirillales bacterium]